MTEDQRVKDYRAESLRQLQRQTTALEAVTKKVATIGVIVALWFALTLIGVLVALVSAANS